MTGPPAAARVIFLGTGKAVNLERFQSAIVVEAAGLRVLLDTGGGLDWSARLVAASIEPASIGRFFLSHRHLDHVGGLEPFLLTVGLAALRRGEAPRVPSYDVPPESAFPASELLAEARRFAPGIEVTGAEDGLVLTV